MADPARKKLKKSSRQNPTPLEEQMAKALFELEVNHKNLKTALTNLYVNTVKEEEVAGKRTLVVFFPLRFIRKFHKIQKQLVQELEKKFQGMMILLVAQRRIARKPKSNMRSVQRSRTMAAVHEAILDDIVYPADIVGKRVRVKPDGSKHTKVFLDAREKDKADGKIEVYSAIYRKLTGKDCTFGFMSNPALQQFV